MSDTAIILKKDEATRGKSTVILASFLAATTSIAADWFVAKDGDDANSGASRAEAKATIPAAYACLADNPAATIGDRLVICDGEWSSTDFGSTLVLSNGWSVVGEHGRGATTLKAASAFVFFDIASADASIRGLTLDFNRADVTYQKAAVENPYGTIADCEFRDYYSTWIANGAVAMIRVSQTASTANITNCVFRRCANKYNGPSAIRVSKNAKADIIGCEFVDCVAGDSGNNAGGTIFAYCGKALVRNCLFFRSVVYGGKSSSYSSYAGVVCCNAYGSDMTVENCTFAECRIVRRTDVGVVQVGNKDSKLTVRNCLAYGNVNDAGPVGFVTNFVPTAYSNCASEFELAGTDNVVINADNTTFREARDGRYIPLSGPALDGAQTLPWMEGAVDMLGRSRVVGSAPDIGCFENPGTEPRTYYVAKDGNDANSGLTRAEAKATIPAGYALLSDYDETLVIGDGEWEVGLDPTFVLSNGWTVCSENGAAATTLKFNSSLRSVQNSTDLDVAHSLFDLKTPACTVSGFTIDLSTVNMRYVHGALLKLNSTGVLTGCIVRNFYTSWEGSLIRIADKNCNLDISDCTFTNFYYTYWTAALWLRNGSATIENCRFTDCHAMAKSGTKYFNYGVIYFDENKNASTLRNSLFLRCSACGNSGSYHSSVVSVRNTAYAALENCSFINCSIISSQGGGALGGLQLSSTGSKAVNCFAYSNSTGVAQANLVPGLTYSHCASDIALEGEGNVVLTDSNFRFVNAANGDYRVKRGPSINAGLNLDWMVGATDLAGNPRILDHIVDIGCYESDKSKPTRFLVK